MSKDKHKQMQNIWYLYLSIKYQIIATWASFRKIVFDLCNLKMIKGLKIQEMQLRIVSVINTVGQKWLINHFWSIVLITLPILKIHVCNQAYGTYTTSELTSLTGELIDLTWNHLRISVLLFEIVRQGLLFRDKINYAMALVPRSLEGFSVHSC